MRRLTCNTWRHHHKKRVAEWPEIQIAAPFPGEKVSHNVAEQKSFMSFLGH